LQGFTTAPSVVQTCLNSWKLHHPSWKIVELSRENLAEYIDASTLERLNELDLPPQKLANLVRLYLLSRHGGVWADATCLCRLPLDEWLWPYFTSGFFAFRDPGPDRVLSNWFLASRRENVLTSTMFEKHLRFFEKVRPSQDRRPRLPLDALTINGTNATLPQLWSFPLAARLVGGYPYRIFHYQFARVVRNNRRCRRVWKSTPYYPAAGPCALFDAGLASPMTGEIHRVLRDGGEPLFKLSWYFAADEIPSGSILDYLLTTPLLEY